MRQQTLSLEHAQIGYVSMIEKGKWTSVFRRFPTSKGTIAAIIIILGAAVLRLLGSFNDLWLDEIWSLRFAQAISSPIEVFTKINHTNNHLLNTLSMYLLGTQQPLFVYRLPSVVAGVGAVLVAGLIARSWGESSPLTTMLLTACSYLLIHYSSEARGYALLILSSLTGFYLLLEHFKGKRYAGACFSVVCMIGFLAHAAFAQFYSAALLWCLWRMLGRENSWRALARHMVHCHVVPLVFGTAVYALVYRRMELGGGDPYSLSQVLLDTSAWAVGAPDALGLFAATIVLVLTLCGLWMLWSSKSDLWVFFGLAILGAPAVVLVKRPELLFVRYFLISVVFFLVLLGYVLTVVARRSNRGRFACALVVGLFLAGNGVQMFYLLRFGRGQYQVALRLMLAYTDGPVVTVGSDHDFQNSTVLQFYARRVMTDKRVIYYMRNSPLWPQTGVEWLILHNVDPRAAAPEDWVVLSGNRYHLVARSYSTRLTGLSWFIYHKSA